MKSNRGASVGYDGENVTGLGYALGMARTDRRLSLKQVSSVLGVSISFISAIEHGRRPLPAKYVVAVSQLLNLDPSTVAALSLQKTRLFQDFKKTLD